MMATLPEDSLMPKEEEHQDLRCLVLVELLIL